VAHFVERTLGGATAARFRDVFLPLQKRVAFFGMLNSLAQVTLKIASPGVPDFYQGAELWDLSLVDPDNRRPVDYGLRRRLLEELEPALAEEADAAARAAVLAELLEHWPDGRLKLYVTAAGLRLRRRLKDVFLCGSYEPLHVHGSRSDHVVAFARRRGDGAAIAVAPRLCARLANGEARLPLGAEIWEETRLDLPADVGSWQLRNVFTGERLPIESASDRASARVADLLNRFPVALLGSA
jgi:(1->4)-alpha-D-glucan 1-alpha-D-glucosylmutase